MEKGIDVWLALEAYELCVIKQFDVVVLIASDGDYAPLIRKINSLGSRMMVLCWEFDFTNEEGNTIYTRTSHELLNEASYPVMMHKVVDNPAGRYIGLINNIFVQGGPRFDSSFRNQPGGDAEEDENDYTEDSSAEEDETMYDEESQTQFSFDDSQSNISALQRLPAQFPDMPRALRKRFYATDAAQPQGQSPSGGDCKLSYILSLKNGYGFIKYPPNNLFFHFSKLSDTDFNQLHVGDKVEFRITQNDYGEDIAADVRLVAIADELSL